VGDVILLQRTSQLVAVKGTLENSQPSREGLSEDSRTYWSVLMIVSPPKSHQRLCISESRYGCARSEGIHGCAPLRVCACGGVGDLRAPGCECVAMRSVSGGYQQLQLVHTYRDGLDVGVLNQTHGLGRPYKAPCQQA
jgi:hypothetical protein